MWTPGQNDEKRVVWKILEEIKDPEIPVVSIVELGIVRDIIIQEPRTSIEVIITPTYSGCPAMDVVRASVKMLLVSHGYNRVTVSNILSPAWTTDWISDEGKKKMKAFGIAPPIKSVVTDDPFIPVPDVECPLCNSKKTAIISEFGSTSCKALYRCNDCLEPFDVFKCH